MVTYTNNNLTSPTPTLPPHTHLHSKTALWTEEPVQCDQAECGKTPPSLVSHQHTNTPVHLPVATKTQDILSYISKSSYAVYYVHPLENVFCKVYILYKKGTKVVDKCDLLL